MKTRFTKAFILFATTFAIPFLSYAQGGPPGDPNDTPIDSWLVVLIILAVLYGVKKVFSIALRKGTTTQTQAN